MRANREELLRCLESVSPGLATRDVTEQASCYVFRDDKLITFNDEVAAFVASPLKGLTAAVPAKPLTDLLSKLTEDAVDLAAEDGELKVKGKSRRAGIRIESDITMPLDLIETPEEWADLHPEFGDAVAVVASCASKDDANFVLTCIHVHPDYLEACDNFQILRYPIKTGVEQECLIRSESLRHVTGFDMTEISVTDAWLHFRNRCGLTISCRRWAEEYEDFGGFFEMEDGEPTTLPGGLAEAVGKAEVFSADNAASNQVMLKLKDGKLLLRGEGASGWYEERKTLKYGGKPIEFMIAPSLLVRITEQTNDCFVSAGRLKFDAGKFVYCACLGEVK